MRRILVAIDGSESALRGLDFAARLARLEPPAELHVLTIKQPANAYTAWEIYVTAERIQQVADERARSILDAAAERLRPTGRPFALEVLEGEPAELIAGRALQLDCESIVMGTHGLGQLGVLIMGSVAQRVLHHTRLPVTLVK